MTVNITTGKIDIPFETYVDGERVVIDQPDTMYKFNGSVVNFVKDFTTSEIAQFNIDAFGTTATIHDGHRYNAATVSVSDGAVFVEYTDSPSQSPAPLSIASSDVKINNVSYKQGNYYIPSIEQGSTITLSQSKYETPLWTITDNDGNQLAYIGNDVQIIV